MHFSGSKRIHCLRTTVLKKGNTTQNEILHIESKNLEFDTSVKSIPPFYTVDNGFNYASAGLKIYLRRKSLGLLFGSFYGPTAIFAMLSMLSYCINPDMVIR